MIFHGIDASVPAVLTRSLLSQEINANVPKRVRYLIFPALVLLFSAASQEQSCLSVLLQPSYIHF